MRRLAFLPLKREELGLEFPRRMISLQQLIKDATDRAVDAGWAEHLQVQAQYFGAYGQYIRLSRVRAWFGIDFFDWASTAPTPLWLWFQDKDLQERTRRALEPLRHPPKLFEDGNDLVVPVELPVGVESDAVVAAVVKQLQDVAHLIRPSAKLR